MSVRDTFDKAIVPNSPLLEVFKEHSLVWVGLTSEDLKDEDLREDIIDQALVLYSAEPLESKRQEILSALEITRPDDEMDIASDMVLFQPPKSVAILRRLDGVADVSWERAMIPIREQSTKLSSKVAEAVKSIEHKDYEKTHEILREATDLKKRIDVNFKETFSEQRMLLRREYNSQYGKRLWDDPVKSHFQTVVHRTKFLPPEEMRSASHVLNETNQKLVEERSYTSELEKRPQVRPAPKAGSSLKP